MIAWARPTVFSDPLRNRNHCLGRDPYYGNHWLQRLNLSKRFKPVLICRCASLHRILHGVKCAMQTITAVPAAGMARKRSYHLQPRCWNEYCWFNFSGEFETSLLNWLCKAGKEVVVSLPNFLCILISRSLSTNLNLKYTRVFKHKRIHNCITHSKVSRNTMASDAATFHNCRRLLHHTQLCTIVQDDVLRTTRRCNNFDFGFIWWLLVCQTLRYFSIWNVKSNGFPKLLKALSYSAVHEISKRGPIFCI